MTQAYNLALLANAVDTAGKLNVGTNATGTLPVANGGSGQSALTANNVLLGNGTSGVQFVAPGASGNILTSNGTTWTSATPSGGGETSLNGQTGAITNTDLGVIGSYATALHAVTANQNTNTLTLNQNDTVSGANLRTSWSANNPVNMPIGYAATSFVSGGPVTVGYNRGGNALSGTWRVMNRGAGYSNSWSAGGSGCPTVNVTWTTCLVVRIS